MTNPKLAIENNLEALARLMIAFVAMFGFAVGAKAALPGHFRYAVQRLLRLAQAGRAGQPAVAGEDQPFELPDILAKQPDEYLTAQNIAARVPALYRAWDELEAQCGRLVRWRGDIDGQPADIRFCPDHLFSSDVNGGDALIPDFGGTALIAACPQHPLALLDTS